MAETILEATGRDLAKTLIKQAYFDASNALALTEAERNELRTKAITLQGLGEVPESVVVSRNPADVAKAKREYDRVHMLMMERCEFVASQGTAAMQKERAVALQKASEWRQGAVNATRRGEHDLAYERRNSADHFEHLAECLEKKLYPPKPPSLPPSYPPVATQAVPRFTVTRPPTVPASTPTLMVMPRRCAFIRNLDDALTVSKTIVPGNDYSQMHGVRGVMMGRRPYMPSMRLAQSRLSPRARLGQYQDPAAAEAAILALIPTMPLADAFTKYTIDTTPSYINMALLGWENPPGVLEVKRALLFFERNYASKQNARRAASWGVRFPEDLRADLAYLRADLVDVYDELFGISMGTSAGFYEQAIGTFDSNSPEDVAAEAALGPTPTIAVDGGNFSYIVSLINPTDMLNLWYAHVYRSLQIFVPVLAKMMVNADIPAEDIYGALQLPVKDAPKFVLWVVAANTFMFERLQSPKALRGLLDDAMLNDVLLGFDDAARIYGAEAYFLKKKGLEIKAEISWLEAAQFIMQILSLPAKILQNLPKLGEWPWYYFAGIAVGGLVVVGGTLFVLNRI